MIKGAKRWARMREATFLCDRVSLAVILGLFLTISVVGWIILGSAIFVATSTIMVAVLVLAHRRTYQQVQLARRDQERLAGEQQRLQLQHYRQTEALFSLFSLIRLSQPLPSMLDNFSIQPDFANVIITLIRERKPSLIVEAGSGVSTLVAAYALKDLGRGTIVSLEHEEQYLTMARRHIKRHGLEDIATVRYAPLKEVTIRGERWLWYDTVAIASVCPIDMMIIDGPPGYIGKWARYPALPLLFDRLSDDAVVLLDDIHRQDEHEIMEAWMREFRCFEAETVNTLRGAVIMRQNRGRSMPSRDSCQPGVSASGPSPLERRI